jgi:gamma-glutamyl-gamma-aminobutyrate hydrolase PuuD
MGKLTFHMPRPDYMTRQMFLKHGFEEAALEDALAVVFTGGADVNPFLYGEKRRKETHVCFQSDYKDIRAFKKASVWQFKVGICRGGQFLNVMCGGSMYQHVTDHAMIGFHPIYNMIDTNEESVQVTSTHHQMMIPGELGQVLYATNRAMEKYTDTEEIKYNPIVRSQELDDTEVVLYQDMHALCFQPHPEYVQKGNEGNTDLFFKLIAKYALSDQEAATMREFTRGASG